MREAADKEDASEKSVVTPGRLVPARELLGDMLLDSAQPEGALAAYEASQVRDPRRFRGFWGVGQAAERAGSADKARAAYTQLVELAAGGDDRPELAAARAYLAAH
jgi:predicted TPR repeat methyltransferase